MQRRRIVEDPRAIICLLVLGFLLLAWLFGVALDQSFNPPKLEWPARLQTP